MWRIDFLGEQGSDTAFLTDIGIIEANDEDIDEFYISAQSAYLQTVQNMIHTITKEQRPQRLFNHIDLHHIKIQEDSAELKCNYLYTYSLPTVEYSFQTED
jgi:hypothetical protein